MSDEINSPPYPKDLVNVDGLCNCLMELIDWVNEHRDWVNLEAERLHAPELPFILHEVQKPKSTILRNNFEYLPIVYLHRTYQLIRIIRESYDQLIRNNESIASWNSDTCILQRILLIKNASELLKFVCMDREKQEAWFVSKMKAGAMQRYKQAQQMIKQIISDDSDEFEDDDDDDELDNLFNQN